MKKTLPLLCVGVSLLGLFGCGKADTADPNAYSVVDTAPADLTERVSITSLDLWSYFNADGNYTDNCLRFLRDLINGTSEFPELAAVKIGAYELVRDPHEYEPYQLYFAFDVTESSLPALPCGHYETVLDDVTDCYLTYKTAPLESKTYPDYLDNTAAKAVIDWIECDYSWDTPGYGNFAATKAAVQKLCNYYFRTVGEMPISDFLAAAERDFGVTWTEKDFTAVLGEHSTIPKRAVTSRSCYDITFIRETDENYAVTVQFYADCNKWVNASVLTYTVSQNGQILRCDTVEKSPYTPYGLHPTFE